MIEFYTSSLSRSGGDTTATVEVLALDIGDNPSAALRFSNPHTEAIGIADNLAISGSFTLGATTTGPIAAGGYVDITVNATTSGAQSGTLTGDSSAGDLSVAVTSAVYV